MDSTRQRGIFGDGEAHSSPVPQMDLTGEFDGITNQGTTRPSLRLGPSRRESYLTVPNSKERLKSSDDDASSSKGYNDSRFKAKPAGPSVGERKEVVDPPQVTYATLESTLMVFPP